MHVVQVKPLVQISRAEDLIQEKEYELSAAKEKLTKMETECTEHKTRLEQVSICLLGFTEIQERAKETSNFSSWNFEVKFVFKNVLCSVCGPIAGAHIMHTNVI